MTLKEFEEHLTDAWIKYEERKELNRVAILDNRVPRYFTKPIEIRSEYVSELSFDSTINIITDFKAKVTTLKELGHELQDGNYTPAYAFSVFSEYDTEILDGHVYVSSHNYVLTYKILMTDEEILNKYRRDSKLYLQKAIYKLAGAPMYLYEVFTDADYLAFIDGKITADILIDKYYTKN